MEAVVEAQVPLVAEKTKSSCAKLVNDEMNQKLENRLLDNQQLENQLLEDEEDAQSEDSIRLTYSDGEADEDKKIGTSESVNNNKEEKIVNDDQVKESRVVPTDEKSHHHNPIIENGINLLKNDKIDFTKDDPLMGINFCDNHEKLVKNNDDNIDKNIDDNLNNITDDNGNDNIDENGLIPVKEIIDKTITINQFPQSAYDSSWRLGGKSRKRCTNKSDFLRIKNFKKFHNDKKLLDNSNKNLSDKSNGCIVEKISDKVDVVDDEKLTNSVVENECLLKVFPPSLKLSDDKSLVNEEVQDGNDDNKPGNAEIELTSEKINLENDEVAVEKVENEDKDSSSVTQDENTESLPVECKENETLVNGHVDDEPEKSDLPKSDDKHDEKQDDVVMNETDDSNVQKEIEKENNVESVENDSTVTEPMADESSDSGIVSTPTSVTTIDELLKDETEELKDKTNDETPKLSSEVTLESIITKKSFIPEKIEVDPEGTDETIEKSETETNPTLELMEVDDDEKISETNESAEKQETIVTNEELTDSKAEKSITKESTKPETSSVDNEKSLPAGFTEIVNLDDCPEVTIEPVIKKSDILKDSTTDNTDKLIDPPKSETLLNNSESVDIENFDISILNESQEDANKSMTSKTDKRKRRSARSFLGPEKENVRLRVKRETAQKAEELIRKDCQDDTEDESESDDSDVLRKSINPKIQPTSSSNSLKRNTEEIFDKINIKRPKRDIPNGKIESKLETIKSPNRFDNLRTIFKRESNQSLSKIRQEDLEELLIQKIVETIAMRDEIGKLREQAKQEERAKELAQQKCAGLAKQIKEFDMVMNRYSSDREKNPFQYVAPIKINRSVGLQVNMLGDRGVQNIRQLTKNQQHQHQHILPKTSPVNRLSQGLTTQSVTSVITSATQSPSDDTSQNRSKSGLRIRSPRRPEAPPTSSVITHISNPLNQTRIINSISSPVVMSKIGDPRNSIAVPGITTTPILTNASIVVNGNIANQQYRQTRVTPGQNRNNGENLIDLTEEDEKNKSNALQCPPALTALVTSTSAGNVQKIQQRPPRIITNNSANVTLTQSGIRLMTGQPTPTGIMNNMNGQRLMFIQQGNSPRQLIFTSTANSQQRTVATTNARNSYTNITHTGLPTITTKGTPVRVMPTSGATVQLMKVTHPAPLALPPVYSTNQGWKMPPPAPSLKISKVTHGIVLSWNMSLTDKYAEIASYQLYAYQEISTTPPNSNLWKKVGDVRALPLPMACTLTQFLEGNNYFFAVRAVDTHGRLGEFSQPGNITL